MRMTNQNSLKFTQHSSPVSTVHLSHAFRSKSRMHLLSLPAAPQDLLLQNRELIGPSPQNMIHLAFQCSS